MNLINDFSNSTRNVSTYLVNNSPKVLSASSVVLEVGAVVTTGIATWKAKDVIEAHNIELECMHKKMEEVETEEERFEIRKDIIKLYKNTVFKLSQLYTPAVVCTAGSIITNRIATQQYEQKITELQRNVALLSASYFMLKKAYDESKKRAEEKYGEEAAADIFYGSTEKEVEVINEKGKKKIEKVKEYDPYGALLSNPCTVLLGDGIDSKIDGQSRWNDINIIKSAESTYTYILNSKGYVFVYDVYKYGLGIEPQSQFQRDIWMSYGWVKDPERIENKRKKIRAEFHREATAQEEIDANKVDLGLDNFVNRRYISGNEPTVWIIPNYLGDITPLVYPDGQKRKYEELMTP